MNAPQDCHGPRVTVRAGQRPTGCRSGQRCSRPLGTWPKEASMYQFAVVALLALATVKLVDFIVDFVPSDDRGVCARSHLRRRRRWGMGSRLLDVLRLGHRHPKREPRAGRDRPSGRRPHVGVAGRSSATSRTTRPRPMRRSVSTVGPCAKWRRSWFTGCHWGSAARPSGALSAFGGRAVARARPVHR